MGKILFIILLTGSLYVANAQAPTSLTITGLQRPMFTSATATTGGSLVANTYWYVVIAVDTFGQQTGYFRGYPATVSSPNNAVALAWTSMPFAKSYKIYRSTVEFRGNWYQLTTTSANTYTDIGGAGSLSVPNDVQTNIGIKGNTGLDITNDAGENVIKLTNFSANYSNDVAVQVGRHIAFGSMGVYGGNASLVRNYMGIRFEPMDSLWESDYQFSGFRGDLTDFRLRPHYQRMYFADPYGNVRTDFYQGVADGSAAVAFKLASWNTLSNSGAKLLSIGNRDVEMFSIMASGNVRAKKITVTQTGWSDFVFKPGYELKSLPLVKAYIIKYGHLPDVPDEQKIKRTGLDIASTQALLLQKIEELTLYVIDLQSQIESLRKNKSNKK